MTAAARVLLVDDETAFLHSTARLLRHRGCLVWTAETGAAALHILAATDIEVAVLDVRMPGMDGHSLLARIKDRFPGVEVMMLSGQATMDAAVSSLNMGAADYLMKPCRIEALLAKIEQARTQQRITLRKRQQAAGSESRHNDPA